MGSFGEEGIPPLKRNEYDMLSREKPHGAPSTTVSGDEAFRSLAEAPPPQAKVQGAGMSNADQVR
eukprot:6252919-Pyramimonas_sp.AAC.1